MFCAAFHVESWAADNVALSNPVPATFHTIALLAAGVGSVKVYDAGLYESANRTDRVSVSPCCCATIVTRSSASSTVYGR